MVNSIVLYLIMIYTEAQLHKAHLSYLHLIKRKILANDSKVYIKSLLNRNGLARTIELLREKYPGIDFLSKCHHICDQQYFSLEQQGLFDNIEDDVI